MKWCGIDLGKSGALALIDTESGEVKVEDTQLDEFRELDCVWAFTLLNDWEPDSAILESCFNNNGLVEMGGQYIAICRLLQIPIQKVAPSKWKRAVLGASTNDKERSIACVQKLYPQADLLRPTPAGRMTNIDHNRAEAVLLAHQLRLTHP